MFVFPVLYQLLRGLLVPRLVLVTENLALRQQLLVLRRSTNRPRLRDPDRLFWIGLSQLWQNWRWHCQLNVLKRLDHELRPARALWSSVDWRSLPKKHRSQLQLPFPRGRILISSHRGIRKLGTGVVPHGSVRQ